MTGAPPCVCPPALCLGGDCERCFGSKVAPLLPGRHVDTEAVRGYYIDLAFRAQFPAVAPPWLEAGNWHVATCQAGLAGVERFLDGDGDEWLAGAVAVARFLIEHQRRDGPHTGGWEHTVPFAHTFQVHPPWISAMAQGEGASLLVRTYLHTGEEAFADAARLALQPMRIPVAEGGAYALLGGRPFPEEYPTAPPSFVLNGAFFALWGFYDVWRGLGDEDAGQWFRDGVDTLAANMRRWDLGYWSRYDLHPHPMTNVASPAYHQLHMNLLRAMIEIEPRQEFGNTLTAFERQALSPRCRVRGLLGKAAFRVVVPRSETLNRHLPWMATRRS